MYAHAASEVSGDFHAARKPLLYQLRSFKLYLSNRDREVSDTYEVNRTSSPIPVRRNEMNGHLNSIKLCDASPAMEGFTTHIDVREDHHTALCLGRHVLRASAHRS
jgi:hypothetical protein